jgi:hypothetical protein
MECVIDLTRPLHSDASWEMRIGSANPRLLRTLNRRIEMHNLVKGVNASICAPGTNGNDWLRSKSRQGQFKTVLHRLTVRLLLPTLPSVAIISDA